MGQSAQAGLSWVKKPSRMYSLNWRPDVAAAEAIESLNLTLMSSVRLYTIHP